MKKEILNDKTADKLNKAIVIYESQTGYTKKYAEWISEELNCEYKARSNIKRTELENYKYIIYGGWIMADMIKGFDKIKNQINPTIVFAVGSCPAYEEVVSELKQKNKVDAPFFYFQGGIKLDKLKFLQKKLIELLSNQIKKKENKTRKEKFMAEYLGTDFDFSSKEQIKELVEYFINKKSS
ncbi:MAG: flavodoxin domain-containing protein [Treponema sp.]|uniref:flavodoxin family protein n=1 Tax=Treponema sp. TaxID=166 RepID=UPI00298E46A6|nr:flavodoxin domain-containing protein [Treponema sp.]MCQ2601702.1 flavodoxin domain-containing protein [Treponema sp.]